MKRILLVLSVVALLGACCNHSKHHSADCEKATKCCEMKKDSMGDGCGMHKADTTKLDTTMGAAACCARKEKPCCASKDSAHCKKSN